MGHRRTIRSFVQEPLYSKEQFTSREEFSLRTLVVETNHNELRLLSRKCMIEVNPWTCHIALVALRSSATKITLL